MKHDVGALTASLLMHNPIEILQATLFRDSDHDAACREVQSSVKIEVLP